MGAKHDYGMFNSRVKPYAVDYKAYVGMMLVWWELWNMKFRELGNLKLKNLGTWKLRSLKFRELRSLETS